jgi:hypothetical protein
MGLWHNLYKIRNCHKPSATRGRIVNCPEQIVTGPAIPLAEPSVTKATGNGCEEDRDSSLGESLFQTVVMCTLLTYENPKNTKFGTLPIIMSKPFVNYHHAASAILIIIYSIIYVCMNSREYDVCFPRQHGL